MFKVSVRKMFSVRRDMARRRVAAGLLLLLGTSLTAVAGDVVRPGRDAVLSGAEEPARVISFHVVANSDSDVDQDLKIQVRNAVASFLLPLLSDVTDPLDIEAVIAANKGEMLVRAREVVSVAGLSYPMRLATGKEDGRRMIRVIIGAGAGHNWFCLLYPTLCTVDADERLMDRYYGDILTGREPPVEVRYAVLDWWESARKRFQAKGFFGLLLSSRD